MTTAVSNFIASYGLLAVFVLMIGESCGFPFPSEVIMPTSGLLAATGQMNLIAAIIAGALANLVGSLIAYFLAARFGEPLLLGPGRYIGIRKHHLELADGWFQRWGLFAVLIGRVLPVVRTYISFPAGLARVDLVRFSALTFIGVIGSYTIPYLLGGNAPQMLGVAMTAYNGSYQRPQPAVAMAVMTFILAAVAGAIYVWGTSRTERTAA